MTKKLARLLRADIQETSDLKSIAKTLANKGRGGDTILAHITPKEVKILKAAGGAGTVNPDTGLMEFYDEYSFYDTVDRTVFEPQAASAPNDYYSDYYQIAPEVSAPEAAPAPAAPVSSDYYSDYYQIAPTGEAPVSPAAAPAEVVPAAAPGVVPITEEARKAQTEQAAAAGGKVPPSLSTRAGDILGALKTGGIGALNFLEKYPQLAKAGAAGAGALLTARQAKQGAQQVQQATTQQKAIASPYQAQGAELQRAAMAGELTPQGAQAYQAARAQLAQGVEQRGGVGVAQAQAQLENLRQQLLQQQADYGIKLSSIGDNIAIGAIRTGLQADQAVNQLTNSMYSNMFAIASGLSPQQIRTQATQGATP